MMIPPRALASLPSLSGLAEADARLRGLAALRDELPVDWPAWPAVRGKHAAIAGGTPREERRIKLERAFALAELDWPEIANPRKVEGLVRRIESGTVDLVILIQNLINHSAADSLVDACKAASVPLVLTQGYGISGLRAALEKSSPGGTG
jgi:hypothetical protein